MCLLYYILKSSKHPNILESFFTKINIQARHSVLESTCESEAIFRLTKHQQRTAMKTFNLFFDVLDIP